ncbi:alpha/beta fold hydrolase [Nocardioides hungaricus]
MYSFFPDHYRWSYNTLLAFAAGAEMGDVGIILPRLTDQVGDDEVWHEAWRDLAELVEDRSSGKAGVSRSEDMFLASLYHTISEHFINPSDSRRLESYRDVLRCFETARQAAPATIERVLVPFEDTTLPAYFMHAIQGAGPRPTVIFVCGLDTTKELWFLRAREQFALRGLNCLFLDTPGVGEALRLQNLYTRHDYERPVGAAVDYLQGRPEVDPERIGLVGSSLGGYYAARSAAYEPRLKATIAWGAIYDYHRVWVERMAGNGSSAAPTFQLMFITGTTNMEDAVERIAQFKVADFAEQITKPFLIMHGAEDQQVPLADAVAVYERVSSPDKSLVVFDGKNGGAAHTQFDNHRPALHCAADWMQAKLG